MATKAAQDQIRKPLAFTTTDVMGSVVICSVSAITHIVTGHPEMRGRHQDIEDTIASPDAIYLSTSSPNALVHQKTALDSAQIRVVTTYDQIAAFQYGTTIAKVNTAFPVDSVLYDKPQIGPVIYQRPAPPVPVPASNEEEGGTK
jgi:hypothetical protein